MHFNLILPGDGNIQYSPSFPLHLKKKKHHEANRFFKSLKCEVSAVHVLLTGWILIEEPMVLFGCLLKTACGRDDRLPEGMVKHK